MTPRELNSLGCCAPPSPRAVIAVAPPLPDWAVDPEAVRWIAVENHASCSPTCRDVAAPSPYDRDRPPLVACTWCGASPGEACVALSSRGRRSRLPLRTFGRTHPSRLGVAA